MLSLVFPSSLYLLSLALFSKAPWDLYGLYYLPLCHCATIPLTLCGCLHNRMAMPIYSWGAWCKKEKFHVCQSRNFSHHPRFLLSIAWISNQLTQHPDSMLLHDLLSRSYSSHLNSFSYALVQLAPHLFPDWSPTTPHKETIDPFNVSICDPYLGSTNPVLYSISPTFVQ